ncbi:hypothetical protein [Rhodococcus sovatensis]|uniref:Ribulose-phosphate 3-epimerase n=1 Tax=Rhodococcus sovatensis TaxID=1805840 RepID=A0ABZ2PK59_9NOCA
MSLALAPWHVDHVAHLAGSIYAAAPGRRVDAARALVDAGIAVHVDVMVPNEGPPRGIDVAELDDIAAQVPPDMLGIHLIGSASGVRRLLPSIPECADLYLPIGIRDRRVATRLWAAVWDEFDDSAPAEADLDGYDGVLVMLLEPGTSGAADLSRLALVETFSRRTAVTVDGGVTPESIDRCRSAGATTLVVGRAILANYSPLSNYSLLEGQS